MRLTQESIFSRLEFKVEIGYSTGIIHISYSIW